MNSQSTAKENCQVHSLREDLEKASATISSLKTENKQLKESLLRKDTSINQLAGKTHEYSCLLKEIKSLNRKLSLENSALKHTLEIQQDALQSGNSSLNSNCPHSDRLVRLLSQIRSTLLSSQKTISLTSKEPSTTLASSPTPPPCPLTPRWRRPKRPPIRMLSSN